MKALIAKLLIMVSVLGLAGALLPKPVTHMYTAGAGSDCEVQPAGNIITPENAERINLLRPLYQQAAAPLGMRWYLLPPLHFRENALRRDNPSNGQGIFQLYSYVGATGKNFTPSDAPVSNEEFVRQAGLALNVLNQKARLASPDGLANASNATVAWSYFGYNGLHPGYFRQARTLGSRWAFQGSPDVYNLFDAEHTGSMKIVQADNGAVTNQVDERPGAFTIYLELLRQCAANGFKTETIAKPFRGEFVPRLPSEGEKTFPWYTLLLALSLPVLVVTSQKANKRRFTAWLWAIAAVIAPTVVHLDDAANRGWSFSPPTVAVIVAGILFMGLIWAVRSTPSLKSFIRSASKWVSKSQEYMVITVLLVVAMQLTYYLTTGLEKFLLTG